MLCMADFLLLIIYLNYTQLVSSMNNMQMEVVLHEENNAYICTYAIYGMYSIPCQPMQYKRLHHYIINMHTFY